MTPDDLLLAKSYPTARQGREDAIHCVETPQTRSPTYRLAYDDPDFMVRDEMRGVRLQLELMKPELELAERNIDSTIVVFGSARAKDAAGDDDAAPLGPFYAEARKFARIVSESSQSDDRRNHVVVTGGGSGIMEAANQGADDAGALSIGLNITLPHEQEPNPYITPGLSFQFHYFAIRKMHFLMRARAMVAFPGGFGTMDELFELLTLLQTQKITRRVAVLIYGREYWQQVVNFEAMVQHGMLSPEDLDLFEYADSPGEAFGILRRRFEDYFGATPVAARSLP